MALSACVGIHAVLDDGPELDGDDAGRGVGGGVAREVEAVFEGATVACERIKGANIGSTKVEFGSAVNL